MNNWKDLINEDMAFDCKYCGEVGIVCSDYDVDEDGYHAIGSEPCVCQKHLVGAKKQTLNYPKGDI